MSKQNKTLLTSRPPLIRRRLSKDPYQKLLPLAARLRSCYVLLYLIFLTTLLHSQAAAQNNSSDWIYLENLNLKLGILKSHGGAIAYLSSAGSNENLLNHYDHGRLVQQSYYGDSDGSKWVDKPWRYNPVQGGDYQGKAAELVEYNTTSTSVYCRTTPRHWANGDLLSECSMEQWTELNEKHVKIHFKFTYQGQHTHKATHQETPAVFVSPRLKRCRGIRANIRGQVLICLQGNQDGPMNRCNFKKTGPPMSMRITLVLACMCRRAMKQRVIFLQVVTIPTAAISLPCRLSI